MPTEDNRMPPEENRMPPEENGGTQPEAATEVAQLPLFHQVPGEEFAARRNALRQRLHDGLLLVEANIEDERGNTRSGFFQEPNFAWLSGWLEPGAALLLAPADAPDEHGDLLFLPEPDAERALWTGAMHSPTTLAEATTTGYGAVYPMAMLEENLQSLASRYPRLYALPGAPTEIRLQAMFPLRQVQSAQPLLAQARMVKSTTEIALIRKAVEITMAGQRRAWRSLQQNRFEYEVAADVTHELLRLGAERHAFAPIVACGANACVLHYTRNRDALRLGSLTIVDIGAERSGYCGDLTRTIPVGGRFSDRQRELYRAVLHVQQEVIRAVKPGASISRHVPGSLHQLAVQLFDEFPRGSGSQSLASAFPHGIGHHLGMDVHDLHDPNALLAPGMVITVEPGVYLPEEGIGIRIEEDVLVTETGCEVLSQALEREPDALEEWLKP
jgi:Xaa-Pro aminopeptidase